MVLHPECPCSHASLDELQVLDARAPGGFLALVLFEQPAGSTDDVTSRGLWRDASRIPGVVTKLDLGGVEGRAFGAHVSGQTFLYAVDGRLLYSGGLTQARGHEGDNDGLAALTGLLRGGPSASTAPVFGCPLARAGS